MRSALPQDAELQLTSMAERAGERIMTFYRALSVGVSEKADHSPLSEADTASHEVLHEALTRWTPDLPIVSEEGDLTSQERLGRRTIWLVDPLDGTKEFLKHQTDFTVNVALVEDGRPVAGVVHVPALGLTYYGRLGEGAVRRQGAQRTVIRTARPPPADALRVVASKSHLTPETTSFLERLSKHVLVQAGSSLKFCRVAEGVADLYPRFGRTMEWDTAAGHAVLAAAGGDVRDVHGAPLLYNKADLANPHFLAAGDPRLIDMYRV